MTWWTPDASGQVAVKPRSRRKPKSSFVVQAVPDGPVVGEEMGQFFGPFRSPGQAVQFAGVLRGRLRAEDGSEWFTYVRQVWEA